MMDFTVLIYWLNLCLNYNETAGTVFVSKRCEVIQFTGTQIVLAYNYTRRDLSSDTCSTTNRSELFHRHTLQTNGWVDVRFINNSQLEQYNELGSCNNSVYNVSSNTPSKEFLFTVEINTNSSYLLFYITGNEQFTLKSECSCNIESFKNTKQPVGLLLLLVGSSLMGASLILTLTVVISVCCLLKRYKKMDKKDDSKQIKSSQGDTYEVIKETEDGQFTISSPSSYHPVGGANTYTANELNAGIKTRHMSKSSGQSNDSLYSLADGDQETKVKESSVYQEDYETISHTAHQSSNCKVATPFLMATSAGSFTLPQLKSVTPKQKDIPCTADPSTGMRELPESSPTAADKHHESTYQALDHSGRSHSVDLTAMASYDDVVDVRAARSPRQCCKTADVVLNNERPFDFKPKFFSENMYSLQRPVESEGSSTDGGDEGEEHIYEAYSGDDTEEMVDDKNTPRKKVRVVTMKPLSVTKEDYDTCTLVELDLPTASLENDEVVSNNGQHSDQYEKLSEMVQGSADLGISQSSDALTAQKLDCDIQVLPPLSSESTQSDTDKVTMDETDLSVTSDSSHSDISMYSSESESTSERTVLTGEPESISDSPLSMPDSA